MVDTRSAAAPSSAAPPWALFGPVLWITTAGAVGGLLAIARLMREVLNEAPRWAGMVVVFALVLVAFAAAGLAQGVFIFRVLRRGWMWAPATALAAFVAIGVLIFIEDVLHIRQHPLREGLLAGGLLGLAQWLGLRAPTFLPYVAACAAAGVACPFVSIWMTGRIEDPDLQSFAVVAVVSVVPAIAGALCLGVERRLSRAQRA